MYAEFMRTLTADPSAGALLELAERITGCPVAITDAHGAVRLTSSGYTGEPMIAPPALLDVTDGKCWDSERAAATPVAAPGEQFVWLVNGADPLDTRHRSCLFLVAEFTHLLSTFDLADRDPERHRRWGLVERLLNGADPDRIEREARELGISVATTTHVVIIGSSVGLSWQPVSYGIGARIRRYGLLTVREGRLVMVVFGQRDLDDLLATLHAIDDAGPLRIGVSAPRADGFDLRQLLEQARTAADGPEPGTIARFTEQDPVAVIAHLADAASIELFVNRALGPLLDYDRAHRSELLLTLREWLDSTDSLDALAERLHIHRSTLTYRLRRLRELLGEDLRDPDRRFEMSLALRLRERRGTTP
jgi:hypothetical protein